MSNNSIESFRNGEKVDISVEGTAVEGLKFLLGLIAEKGSFSFMLFYNTVQYMDGKPDGISLEETLTYNGSTLIVERNLVEQLGQYTISRGSNWFSTTIDSYPSRLLNPNSVSLLEIGLLDIQSEKIFGDITINTFQKPVSMERYDYPNRYTSTIEYSDQVLITLSPRR